MIISGTFFTARGGVTKQNLNNLIFQFNIAITAFFIFFQLTFEEKPKNSPSAVAEKEPPKKDIMVSFEELRTNKNFGILACVFGLILGNFFGFGILLSAISTPFGLDYTQLSIMGACLILSGVIGGVIGTIFLDRTRMYKNTLVFCSTFIVIA